MNLQTIIICWNGYVSKTLDLEKKLKKFGNVTVINSNPNFKNVDWINLDDKYFSEQWNIAIQNINDNIDFIFHIQADAIVDDFDLLLKRFTEISSKYDIGVYAPNPDYTWHQYKIELLKNIEPNLYEVPNTDCTCWFINNKIIDKKPLYNLKTNYIGYGNDWYYIAKSILNNKLVVRDYSIKINHPRKKEYDGNKANELFVVWLEEQTSEIKEKIKELIKYHNYVHLSH